MTLFMSSCNYHYKTINPTDWLCGELVAEVSPYDPNDTVVAMKVKYDFHSDMNGLTYYLLKDRSMYYLLDSDRRRKDSIEMCIYYNKPFVLYPNKSLSDLPPEVLECNNGPYLPDEYNTCKLDASRGVLILNYRFAIFGGLIYDKVRQKGDTLHIFEFGEQTRFENPPFKD